MLNDAVDLVDVLKGYYPVHIMGNQLILFKNGSLHIYNIPNKKTKKLCRLFPLTVVNRTKYYYPIIRILRKNRAVGNRWENYLVVGHGGTIYTVDLDKKKVVNRFNRFTGKSPLQITLVSNNRQIPNGFYFGEYFKNDGMGDVSIFYSGKGNDWEKVYTFPKGVINHIHNIINDPNSDCLWVLAGDFGKAASIWRVDRNFKRVTPVFSGDQHYRSCIAFPYQNGIIYATDSQFLHNSVRFIGQNSQGFTSESLFSPLNGPVIYGTQSNSQFVFSTATEPAFRNINSFLKLLDRKPGPGILANSSEIVIGTPEIGFNVIYQDKKDIWPYLLGQFGSINFPSGEQKGDKLVFYNTANKRNKFSTLIYRINRT